jgi:NTP pyrophosphatase (non-canonical NTP hydrolase)
MSLSKYREIYKKTGETACLELLAEECTELAHACLKLARKQRGECPTPATQLETVKAIHEEIADVELCIEVLACARWYDNDRCTNIFYEKLKRWLTRTGVKKHGHQRTNRTGS